MESMQADGPRADVMNPACPSRLVLRRMGARWTPLVLEALDDGPLRFSAVAAAVGGVTPKVLTQTLRSMERDGFVRREIYAEVPARVEYSLTPLGRSLLGPLHGARLWAEANLGEILAAHERWNAEHPEDAHLD